MTTKTILLATAAATSLLAPAAHAQTFEARMGFGLGTDAPIIPNPLVISGGSQLTLWSMFGAFGAQGFTNYGLASILGQISMNDPAGAASLSLPSTSFRSPYNFGSLISMSGGGTGIQYDAQRSVGTVTLPWLPGEPQPFPPPFAQGSGGPDSLFAGFRMFFNPGSTAPRTVTLDISGPLGALTYNPVMLVPPMGDTPGFAEYAPQIITMSGAGQLIIIIPAPGAAATLGLAGLLAARRRRTS